MDSSTEELQRLLSEQSRGLLFMRDELAGWLGAHDRYGGNGADRAFYNETWNGGPFVADRVKNHGMPVRITRASLAMLSGLQPDLLREVMAAPDDGLAAKFIYVWPVPVAVADLAPDEDIASLERRQKLVSVAQKLVGLDMPTDKLGAPAPEVLRVAGEAFTHFQSQRRIALEKAVPRAVSRPVGTARRRPASCAWRWSMSCWLGVRAPAASRVPCRLMR